MTPSRWIALVIALVCTIAGVFTYVQLERREAVMAATGDAKPSPCTAPKVECPDADTPQMKARGDAIDAYRVAIVTSLARTGDPDALLAAADHAVWLRVGKEGTPPPAFDPHALLARATRAATADTVVWYAAAAERCEAKAAHCPADDARVRLLELDADNAAAWLLEFEREDRRGNAAKARAALARAAKATQFRDYIDELQRRVLRASLADPNGFTPIPGDELVGFSPAEAARFHKLMDAASAYTFGSFPVQEFLVRYCHPERPGVAVDKALQDDCRAVGAAMAVEHASATMQTLGVVIESRLTADGAARDALLRRKRDLDWMRHVEIHEPAFQTFSVAWMEHEIAARLQPIGEVERRRQAIVGAGLSPTAPEGWELER